MSEIELLVNSVDARNRVRLGRIGEKLAVAVLRKQGFKVDYVSGMDESECRGSYDLLAEKEGKKFSIEVKTSMGSDFSISKNNLEGIISVPGATPSILLINRTHLFFFVLDTNVSKPLNEELKIEDDMNVPS